MRRILFAVSPVVSMAVAVRARQPAVSTIRGDVLDPQHRGRPRFVLETVKPVGAGFSRLNPPYGGSHRTALKPSLTFLRSSL